MPRPLIAIDLFSGCGGLSLGLTRAGFRVLTAVDVWDTALKSYQRNLPHRTICADVSQFGDELLRSHQVKVPEELDLVAGGPPCQGFSIQRIGADHDPRNSLVLQFARVVLELRPKAFLMENVTGLLGKRGKEVADAFRKTLTRGGYEITSTIINAADYGLPQLRRRVFIVGWRSPINGAFRFPLPTHDPSTYRTVMDVISDLPHAPARESANDPLHFKMRLSALNEKRLSMIPPGKGFESLPPELRVQCHRNGSAKIGHRNVYGRLAADRPAGTITARFDSFTRGMFAHPVENRNITLREGARLQTFPDSFEFIGTQEDIAAQIGNAVPPQLGEILAQQLAKFLLHGSDNPMFRRDELRLTTVDVQ